MGILLLRYLIIYFIILFGSMFITYKTNKKFEKTVGPYFGILILIMYLFGIFDILKYGVYFVSAVSIILGIYAIIKDKDNVFKKTFTPGFAFFSVLYMILFITSYNKNLIDYDHFSYRSFNTKIMFHTDTIRKGFQALYPPSINLLEYFFLKVMGTYIQGIEAVCVQLFSFALFLPLFDRIKNTKFLNFIITMCIILVPTILANLPFYESAYPDALLGIIIGYVMFVLYEEESNIFKLFTVSIMFCTMTLTKPSGFYISVIVIGMYLLVSIFKNKKENKFNIKRFIKSREFKNIVVFILVIVIALASWKVFEKINSKYNNGIIRTDPDRLKENKIEYLIDNIVTTVFGYNLSGNHLSADSNMNLLPAINSLYAIMSPARIPLYGAIALIILAMILVYKYAINDDEKVKYKHYAIALIIGFIVYVVFLQASYVLKFSTEEMLSHAGLNRYMPTFMLGMIYFILFSAIKNMEIKNVGKIGYVILLSVILCFSYLTPLAEASILSGITNIYTYEYTNNGRVYANNVNSIIEDNEEIVCVSEKEETDIYNFMFRFYLYPDHFVYSYNGFDENTINTVKNRINQNNIKYLFVYSVNENEKIPISDYNDEIKDMTLYEIEHIGEKIKLREIPLD